MQNLECLSIQLHVWRRKMLHTRTPFSNVYFRYFILIFSHLINIDRSRSTLLLFLLQFIANWLKNGFHENGFYENFWTAMCSNDYWPSNVMIFISLNTIMFVRFNCMLMTPGLITSPIWILCSPAGAWLGSFKTGKDHIFHQLINRNSKTTALACTTNTITWPWPSMVIRWKPWFPNLAPNNFQLRFQNQFLFATL